jgi:hypothetical protein
MMRMSGRKTMSRIVGVALSSTKKFLGFVDEKGKIRKGKVRRLKNADASLGYYVWIDENYGIHIKKTNHPLQIPAIQIYGPYTKKSDAKEQESYLQDKIGRTGRY